MSASTRDQIDGWLVMIGVVVADSGGAATMVAKVMVD